MKKRKRRHYFVKKDVQFRYLALVLIPLIMLLAGLYYLMYYTVLSQILIPEGVVTMLLPAMKRVNFIAAVSLPVILLFILRIALVYSNRLVGPIPRIEAEIDRIIAGDYSLRLKVRDKDELSKFVHKVNMLLDKIEKERAAI
jgi:signal transduction histidine kinase